MQSTENHNNSPNQTNPTYRNFFPIAFDSLHRAGQAIAEGAEEARHSSQARMANRPERDELSPLHSRLRELALQEAFKDVKELCHKLIDRLEAHEFPNLFACLKKLSETDTDDLEAFLMHIIDSINPDSIEEDLKNITTNLWTKMNTSHQLKKPTTRKPLIIPDTLRTRFTQLGDAQLTVVKTNGQILELTCPISLEIMSDPVKLKASGKIFDRASIIGWLGICRENPRCPLTKLPITERPFEDAIVFDEDTEYVVESILNLGKKHGYEILKTDTRVNFERFQRIGRFNDLTIQAIAALNVRSRVESETTIDPQILCPITKEIITRPVKFKDSPIVFDASSLDDLISQSLSVEGDGLIISIDGRPIYESPEGLSKEESLRQFLDGIQTDVQSLITIGMKVQNLVKNFIEEHQYRQSQTVASRVHDTARRAASAVTRLGAGTMGLFAAPTSETEATRQEHIDQSEVREAFTRSSDTRRQRTRLGHINQSQVNSADPFMEPISPTEVEADSPNASDRDSFESFGSADIEVGIGNTGRL